RISSGSPETYERSFWKLFSFLVESSRRVSSFLGVRGRSDAGLLKDRSSLLSEENFRSGRPPSLLNEPLLSGRLPNDPPRSGRLPSLLKEAPLSLREVRSPRSGVSSFW